MNTMLHPDAHPILPTSKGSHYRSVRTYGEILMFALLILHVFAFLGYRWVERGEIESELIAVARTLPESGFGQHASQIAQYPGGIVVARRSDSGFQSGFSEEFIAGSERIVYSVPGTDLLVAKSEDELSGELYRFGAILAILFAGEVIILLGWWSFIKEKIGEMFSV